MAEGATFVLPEKLYSAQGVEFLGFNEATSKIIFENWNSRPAPASNPDDLIDYVCGHVSQLNSITYTSLASDEERLQMLGATEHLKRPITGPEFTMIYKTETLLFWLIDTVRTNWNTLENLLVRFERGATARVHKGRRKRAQLRDTFGMEAEHSLQSNTSGTTATFTGEPEDCKVPKAHVAIQADAPLLEDHLVLYMGKAIHQSTDPTELLIGEDGILNMRALRTYPGGDFHFDNSAWYWTPERETAERYRQYAARRCPASSTCIIRIQVPSAVFAALKQEQLWYSRDWKEYVWHCKKELEPPARFDKYVQADVIQGHIATGLWESSTGQGQEHETLAEINKHCVLTPGNNRARQVVFTKRCIAERVAKEVRGKVHVELHPEARSYGTLT
jgi:hypothetical protein